MDNHGDAFDVENGRSDIPDDEVVRCLMHALEKLHVPPHGTGRVILPVAFLLK